MTKMIDLHRTAQSGLAEDPLRVKAFPFEE